MRFRLFDESEVRFSGAVNLLSLRVKNVSGRPSDIEELSNWKSTAFNEILQKTKYT